MAKNNSFAAYYIGLDSAHQAAGGSGRAPRTAAQNRRGQQRRFQTPEEAGTPF